MDVCIRPARPDEWAKVRDLRLEALKGSPTAYLERYQDAAGLSADEWRTRAERGAQGARNTKWVAETEDGRWVGSMTGYLADDGEAWVVGVYVAPAFRGRAAGVTDRLLDAIIDWGHQARARRLVLEVREDNEAARRFYVRRGFTETGNLRPYALDPSYNEIEMALSL
jgi:ribosomal protein S18 acetylase RimI-like enzyme